MAEETEGGAVERYRQYLLMLARVSLDPRVQAQVDASDIVQQTLLEAHRCRGQFTAVGGGGMAAWLRKMLANNMADVLRGLARAKRDIAKQRSLDDELAKSSERLGAWLAADQSSPSQHAAREEYAVLLADALAELPEAQREALVLQYWHGWSLAEIGDRMKRSPAAVAGLLKRGMKVLREKMAGSADESSSSARA